MILRVLIRSELLVFLSLSLVFDQAEGLSR